MTKVETTSRWLYISMFTGGMLLLVGLLVILENVHREIHGVNRCGMTFMWRRINMMPVVVPNNSIETYGLYRYHEGDTSNIFYSTPSTIPVLFVPGSGGSANQVRSIASVMQNKTELRGLAYRFHFYSIDFNEELTFLSGHTVERQRDFVIKAVGAVLEIYKNGAAPITRLVLIGHSFGGSIVLSLAAENSITGNAIDLILVKAAPIQAPPIFMDESMGNFYKEMRASSAKEAHRKLRNLGMVSWSGGLADYQISDRLAIMEPPGLYFPTWALDDVSVDADHLCILWCNQFVRHESRLLQAYAENWIRNEDILTSHDVVHKFYEKQEMTRKEIFDEKSPKIHRIRPLLWPWDTDTYKFRSSSDSEEMSKGFHVSLETPESVLNVELEWEGAGCEGPTSVYFQFTNGFRRHATIRESRKKLLFNIPQTLSSSEALRGNLVISSKSTCAFKLTFSTNFYWGIYMLILVHSSAIPHVILDAALFVSSIRLGLNRKLGPSAIILTANAILAFQLILGFWTGTGIRFATLHLRIFVVFFVFTFTIIEPIRKRSSFLITKIAVFSQETSPLLVLALTIGNFFNPHLALGLLLAGISMLSKTSSSFVGGMICSMIEIGIGLAGGVRDAILTLPISLYVERHLLHALPFYTSLFILIVGFVFQLPRKLFVKNESLWLVLPVAAFSFSLISEQFSLESASCFMALWIYLCDAIYKIPKTAEISPEISSSTTKKPQQWNEKFKKL